MQQSHLVIVTMTPCWWQVRMIYVQRTLALLCNLSTLGYGALIPLSLPKSMYTLWRGNDDRAKEKTGNRHPWLRICVFRMGIYLCVVAKVSAECTNDTSPRFVPHTIGSLGVTRTVVKYLKTNPTMSFSDHFCPWLFSPFALSFTDVFLLYQTNSGQEKPTLLVIKCSKTCLSWSWHLWIPSTQRI